MLKKPHKHTIQHYLDDRGSFIINWNTEELNRIGFRGEFKQQNLAISKFGVIRGLHRQNQTKLVQVISGEIFDVAVNPETGEVFTFNLKAGDTVFIPPEYAHGYMSLSNDSIVQYVIDAPYNTSKEEIFNWDGYGIEWPITVKPIMSHKDKVGNRNNLHLIA